MAAAQSVSPAAAAKAAALAEAAEEAEKSALDRDLLAEASRFKNDAESYERSVQDILASAEADAARAAATVEATVPGETGTPRGAAPGKALWAAVAAHTKDNKELLRRVHERGVAAIEMQIDSNKRAAAGRLAQRRAAARAARTEAMKGAGKSQEEITAENTKVHIHAACKTKMRKSYVIKYPGLFILILASHVAADTKKATTMCDLSNSCTVKLRHAATKSTSHWTEL